MIHRWVSGMLHCKRKPLIRNEGNTLGESLILIAPSAQQREYLYHLPLSGSVALNLILQLPEVLAFWEIWSILWFSTAPRWEINASTTCSLFSMWRTGTHYTEEVRWNFPPKIICFPLESLKFKWSEAALMYLLQFWDSSEVSLNERNHFRNPMM